MGPRALIGNNLIAQYPYERSVADGVNVPTRSISSAAISASMAARSRKAT